MAKKNINANDEYFNKVTLRGTIIRKHRKDDSWLVLGLAISSPSGKKDFPSIFWYGKNIDIVDKAYDLHDHVEIEAEIQTNKKHRTQTVVGIDINDTKRELEEKMNLEGVGRFAEDVNEVLLKGDLLKTYSPPSSNGHFIIATMHQKINGMTRYPQIALFGRQKSKVESMEPGTPICIVGHVQTQHRLVNKKPTYFESVIGHYLVSASE